MPKPERRAAREVMFTFLLDHFRSISGGLLLVLMSLSVHMGLQWLQDPWRFPLEVVKIQGDFRYLDKARLQDMVEPQLDGGFFTVDVARVCEVIESMPWVASATVKRIWPDRLRVRVTEQLPVARWGDNGYLNERGEAFVPEPTQVVGDLPALAGPDGHEATVLEQYRAMSRALAPTGLRVAGVTLDDRRAWRLQTDSGVALELGRADTRRRLQRFVQAWPSVFVARVNELQRVDLRYSNGFSVRWQQANAKTDNSKG
jgi:cell division protein FtsQ